MLLFHDDDYRNIDATRVSDLLRYILLSLCSTGSGVAGAQEEDGGRRLPGSLGFPFPQEGVGESCRVVSCREGRFYTFVLVLILPSRNLHRKGLTCSLAGRAPPFLTQGIPHCVLSASSVPPAPDMIFRAFALFCTRSARVC